MNKKRLFLCLLMAMLVPSAMFGQEELTVFEGTETCGEAPMYVYYFDNYTRAQTVFPATELEDMVGSPITAIKFYTTSQNIPYTTVSTFNIYLTEVGATTISSFVGRSGATMAYSGTGDFVATSDGGEITLTFSNPYVYQGGNLLFGCDNTTDSGYENIIFYGQSKTGASISGYNASSLDNVSPTQRSFIPQTTFVYTPSCPRPIDLVVSIDEVDVTNATIGWTETGEATDWILQIATNATFTEGLQEYEVSNNPTKDLIGLIPETRYYARVKALCGVDEESHWSNVINFRPSNTIPLTLNEGTATNEYVPIYGYYVDEYQKSEFIIPASTEGLAAMTDGTINQMTFYLSSPASESWGNAQFQVFMKEVTATEFSTDYPGNLFHGTDNATIVYEGPLDGTQPTMVIDFTTNYHYKGGNLLVGVYETTKGSYKRAYFVGNTVIGGSLRENNSSSLESITTGTVEDFLPKTTFNYLPSNTPKPANLQAQNISSSGATLSWTAAANNVTDYQYQYKTYNGDWTTLQSTTSTSVSLSDLMDLTSYIFQVKAIYSEGESDYASITFTTKQIPMLVNLNYPFEDGFEGEQCNWVLMNGDLTNAWVWGNAAINGGEKALYISNDEGTSNAYTTSGASALVYAVKSFTLEQGLHTFTYDWRANGESSGTTPYDYLRVALIPDVVELTPVDYLPSGLSYSQLPEGWIALDEGTQLNLNPEWNTHFEEIVVPVAGEYKMAFIWRNDNSSGNNPPAAIDNVSITKVSCQTPMDFSYSNLTAFTATLGWSANGSETSWEIEYRVVGDSEWLMETVEENPYTLEGLAELTTYEARVRAVCEGGAAATLPITFTTKQIPVLVDLEHPFEDGFEGEQCDWVLMNGDLTNAWTWGTAVNNDGEHAIYISNDEGFSNAYSTNASALVYAVKSFTLEQGAYDFSYDWRANGESSSTTPYDYLRVALIPDAEEISSSTELPSDLGYNTLPSGWIALDGGTQLNLSTEWNTRFEEIEVPVAGEYKMAFIWRNDYTQGNNPPAAIDNISIGLVSCPMPTELSHIGISSSSVTLSWTVNGTEEAWEVEYREVGESAWQTVTVYENPYTLEGLTEQTTYEVQMRAVCSGVTTTTLPITFTTDCMAYEITETNPLLEDFEGYTGTTYNGSGEIPTCWKNYSEGSILPHITGSGNYHYAHSGTNTLYFYGAAHSNSYVSLPKVNNDLNGLCISFWMQTESATNGVLSLGYILNDDDDFSTFEQIATFDNHANSMVLRGVYLSDIPTTADRLAFRWNYEGGFWYGCCIDDVEISMTTNIFNGTVSNDWNTAANWSANSVPTASDKVLINAAAVISTDAEVDEIAMGLGSLTIADGGQLQHNNEGVKATVQRTIHTYSDEKDNFYLIASPFANELTVGNVAHTNLIANDYDLYKFDQYEDLEWRNYEDNAFTNLFNGMGYLYANSGEGGQPTYIINLNGELQPSNTDKSVNLDYYSNKELAGWNLVGNPFACNAYIGQNFYRLGEDEVDATPASGQIAPMEGVFVKADGSGETITFSRNEPVGSRNKGNLNVNVMHKGNRVDLARVRFGEGQGLEKFQLNPNHTKVYISQEGKDYAVVNAGEVGEIPVSFKAETNGSYTLSFTNEEVSFSYLCLIDNMTGIETDLLETPYYTFNAQTTDYASRFRLVFATGSSIDGDNFGFINGSGNLSIFGIDGTATIQVMDVLGHMLYSETFSGSYEKKLNVAPGVYMLRLINGDDVKVQKIVIK